MSEHIRGLVAAPFAPMHSDGSLDMGIVERYAAFLKHNGVVGAFVNGSTGESASLTTDERLRLAEKWMNSAPAELKVIIHVGHTCLEDCRLMASHAQEIGAWAMGAIAPFYFRLSSAADLAEWCEAVASAAPELPFYYYHIPSMSGAKLSVREFLELAADRIPNLAGVKFTFEDLDDYQRCVEFDGGRFDILFGRDELLLSGLEHGAQGAIGSTYNFAAPLYLKIIENTKTGKKEEAQALQQKARQMIDILLATGFGVGAFKAAMELAGFPCGGVRLPLHSPTFHQMESLRTELDKMGFFEFCNLK